MRTVFVTLLFALLASAISKYNVDRNAISTSGVSSGGYMAGQMLVAYSDMFKAGAGIVAAGPWYCAQGQIIGATMNCMSMPVMISVPSLVSQAKSDASSGRIDDLSNLQSSRLYIYSGTGDTVVVPGVVAKTKEFFSTFIPSANITFKNDIASEHSWVTDNYGNGCGTLGSPYISNCAYDSAGAMLQWIYGPLSPRGQMNASNLMKIDQSQFHSGSISFGSTAYVYVPTSCQLGVTCKLTVVFHGCSQTIDDIGDKFYTHTGVNEWAETNNIIVLYPQAVKSYWNPSNPQGCFDWWGYTNSAYAVKSGPQMKAVYDMVQSLIA